MELEFVPMEHTRSTIYDSWDSGKSQSQQDPGKQNQKDQGGDDDFDDKRDEFASAFLQKSGFNPNAGKKQAQEKPDEHADDHEEKKPKEKKQEKPASSDDEMKSILGKLNQGIEKLNQSRNNEVREEKPNDRPPRQDELGLSEQELKSIEVMSQLEVDNPEKYKGAAESAKSYYKKLRDYKAKWESENPGSQFSLQDDEHADFIEQNHPEIDEKDYLKAEVRLDSRKEFEKFELSNKREKFESEVKSHKDNFLGKELGDMISKIDSEIGDFIKENPTENLKALKESDPIAFKEIDSAASDALALSEEYFRIVNTPGGYQVDIQNNRDHRRLAEILYKREQHIKNSSDEDRIWDGKEFATLKEFKAMSPDERSRHWYIDSNVMNEILKAELSHLAKQKIEKSREDFYGMLPEEIREKTKTLQAKKYKWKKAKKPLQTKSPSISGDGQMSTIPKQNDDGAEEWVKKLNLIRSGKKI